MFRSSLVMVAISLAALSCTKEQRTASHTTQSSEVKPQVALVPLIDRASHDLSWSVSEELTSAITHKLIQDNQLALTEKERVKEITAKFTNAQDPFGPDLSWVKKNFPAQEFVVFLELVEHSEVPLASQKREAPEQLSAELNISARLRVIDVRGETPLIVLQELIHNAHYIPKQFNRFNFFQVPWGKESFSISPVGLAHTELTKEVASRIEDYVLLSKR